MVSQSDLASVLHAIVTGVPERAVIALGHVDDLSAREQGVLASSISPGVGASDNAKALGDALRSLGANRHLQNECYRAAFYASPAPARLAKNPLFASFLARKGGLVLDKWPHYFEVYDRYLAGFRGTDVRVLEIGVYRGGGMDLLREYLGDRARLVGVDIDPVAAQVASIKYTVELGDQTDALFLRKVVEEHGPFDCVIDDGGHTMEQQVASAEVLIPLMPPGSVYIVEDTHTSYWPEHGGGLGRPGTFLEWTKGLLDDINAYHWSTESPPTLYADRLNAVHVHDSVVVLELGRPFVPFSEVGGAWDFLLVDRPLAAVHSELAANAEVARAERDDAVRSGEAAATALALMEASKSWRLTAPLRRLRAARRTP